MAKRLILISPKDLDDESDIEHVGGPNEPRNVWLPAPRFGDFVRKCREDANLSLRKAGERIGISHTYLAQIEQGDGSTHLSVDLYDKIAKAYALDDREVLHRAGFRFAVEEEVVEKLRDLEEERFKRILLDERFVPAGFTRKHLALFPEAVRKYVIQLVQYVDHNARTGGATVIDIMDGKGEA